MNAPSDLTTDVGRWFVAKWRARLADSDGDIQAIARQMRKQGVPVEVTARTLLGSPIRVIRVIPAPEKRLGTTGE